MAADHTLPRNYKQWMRKRFPLLNESIDGDLASNVHLLIYDASEACDAIVSDEATDERERFTDISMIHAALYHHQKRARESSVVLPDNFGSTLKNVELAMIHLADSIGVEQIGRA